MLKGSGVGITARLLALVMLPITVMCVLAGSVVLSRRSTAARALTVEHRAIHLSELSALRSDLQALHSVEAIDARVVQLGVTLAAASKVLGFDVATEGATARAQISRAIASAAKGSPVSANTLESLYAGIDRGLVSPAEAVDRLQVLEDAIGATVNRGLDGLEAETHQPQLAAALESLRATSDMVKCVATPQLIDLSVLWYPVPGTTPQATAALWARFGAESSDYSAAATHVRELRVKSVVDGLDQMEATAQIRTFDQVGTAGVHGRLLTEAGAPIDAAKFASVLRGGLARAAPLAGLVATATVAVRAEASAPRRLRTDLVRALGARYIGAGSCFDRYRPLASPLDIQTPQEPCRLRPCNPRRRTRRGALTEPRPRASRDASPVRRIRRRRGDPATARSQSHRAVPMCLR